MKRILVVARNEVGVLADITRALADEGINIETISAEALQEKGVITLTTNAYDNALRALTNAGFKTLSDDSLVLRLADEPGALAKVAEQFKSAGVNISQPPHHRAERRPHAGSPGRRRPRQGGVPGGQGDAGLVPLATRPAAGAGPMAGPPRRRRWRAAPAPRRPSAR